MPDTVRTDGEKQNKKKAVLSLPRERLQIAAVTLSVASLFLLEVIAEALLHTLFLLNAPTVTVQAWYPRVLGAVSMYLIAMPISFLILRLGKSHAPTESVRMRASSMLGVLAICFGITYVGQLLGILIGMLAGSFTGVTPENGLQVSSMSAPLWVNLVFLGIVTPVAEEIFYRKLVIDRLRRYGDIPAILGAGLLFGLMHGNFYQLFYATAVGCIFGCVYVYTGRLRYTVGMHICINLVGGVYVSELQKHLDTALLEKDFMGALSQDPVGVIMYLLYFGFMVACVVGGVVAAVLLFRRRRTLEAGEVTMTRKEWMMAVLLNPAVYILLSVVAMLFINGL